MTTRHRPEGRTTRDEHWDRLYTRTPLESTGWYESDPSLSLELASRCALAPDDLVVDAGCGASYFLERMLERGHRRLVAIDISEVALRMLEERLGAGAANVRFVHRDLGGPLDAPELHDVALWHDRATLHFLIEDSQRDAYARSVAAAVRPGGSVILATFAPDGAETCSGLTVRRHDAAMMSELLGPEFELLESLDHVHTNPRGEPRPYVYARFRRAWV